MWSRTYLEWLTFRDGANLFPRGMCLVLEVFVVPEAFVSDPGSTGLRVSYLRRRCFNPDHCNTPIPQIFESFPEPNITIIPCMAGIYQVLYARMMA